MIPPYTSKEGYETLQQQCMFLLEALHPISYAERGYPQSSILDSISESTLAEMTRCEPQEACRHYKNLLLYAISSFGYYETLQQQWMSLLAVYHATFHVQRVLTI